MRLSYRLTCSSCGLDVSQQQILGRCTRCGEILEYEFDLNYLQTVKFKGSFTFWRYRPVLPDVPKPISLGEGGTPLHNAERLGKVLGLENLLLKDETRNPTNSFKDRSASLIISDAAGKIFDTLVCATNGNHGASLAAYSAKVDITCHLLVPRSLDLGKLAQMIVYDAHVEEAGGSIEDAIANASNLAMDSGWYQATTELNPLAVEALKTIPFELAEQTCTPEWVVVAMGSGATIHAIWKGFKELEKMGHIEKKPRLIGVQAAGCAPIAGAFSSGKDKPLDLNKVETEATAIRVATPIYGYSALKALNESKGLAVSVTDEEMLISGKEIARSEGIFVEPASAATVACIKRLIDTGEIDKDDSVISLITSSGLKTDDILLSLSRRRRSPGFSSRLATKERILKMIDKRRTYGYDLWKSMGKKMTLGAIYQHLSDLEKRGMISPYPEGKRRYLKITERGKRVLAALDDLRSLF